MKPAILKFAVVVFAGIFYVLPIASAQSLDRNGVTLLRASTTNLNGSGIRVAQVEASSPALDFEVNPAAPGQPTGLFTYHSAAGVATNYPNGVGIESGHADNVAQNFYGLTYGVATNISHVNNLDANYFYTNNIANNSLPTIGDAVVNQSFTFYILSVTDQQAVDSQYDNYSVQNKTLFVSPANNYGTSFPDTTNICAPGTSYNCIGVGAYKNSASINSLGPTPDNGRSKPDITAFADATSYSTPLVAGAAAVLMQAALRGDGGSDTNSAFDMRTIKALLLNGAVKPVDWTNSNTFPLDARYGAGVLNVYNSHRQLVGGKQGSIVSTQVSSGGAHPPTGAAGTVAALSGWNFTTNTSGSFPPSSFDTVHHYYFNVSNQTAAVKFMATATLVWNRHYNATYSISPIGINNLNLFLYDCANSNLITCSTSLVNNVEHFYVTNLAQGRYDLQVWKAGGTGIVSTVEPYALAWQFVPLPTLALAKTGTNLNLTWPFYPAGFVAEANTNLIFPGGWSTSPLPVTMLTNGQNLIQLNASNAAQFFRLHQAP